MQDNSYLSFYIYIRIRRNSIELVQYKPVFLEYSELFK